MDAFNRCKAKGGRIKIVEKRRVCFLKGWGPVAESKKVEAKKKHGKKT